MTSPEFSGTDRFEVLSRLGAGGMGVVYEVFDRERHARVALKKLRAPSPEALLRFKKEFRALEKVQHPNLVMLGELIEDGGEWFFTMELVDGIDFMAYVRPEGVLDLERLRQSLRQLVSAIAALHAAGKIHRDIKPANMIIERGGRLALIDLGLVLELDSQSIPDRDAIAGTANYMAPEQAVASSRVGPEADWYSVGVLLFHALTDQLPFDGTPLQVMLAKQQHAAPPADGLVPGLPGDLVLLADQMLATDPDARPTDAEVLRRLGVAVGSQASASGSSVPFVGRAAEIDALIEAFGRAAHAPVSVLVEGHSGVGKSSLVQRFVARLDSLASDQRVLVLNGRCHERETVPFKAVDEIVDGLAKFLGRQPESAVQLMLPPGARALTRVFPVLRQVEAIAIAPSKEAEPADDRERRARVFGAFRELFARLAAYRRLVIVIDDLQWADADSAVLLRELLRGPDAPRMLLVATVRTGGDAPPVLDLPGEVAAIELTGLPADDALALARLHAEQLELGSDELA
ncbi:MAG TPA: serine/threonine-protein kinase, partial [Kofleriaceae bacterium]|nr:serine/threonine-protein kinase [Kofleriaceae bacterium]